MIRTSLSLEEIQGLQAKETCPCPTKYCDNLDCIPDYWRNTPHATRIRQVQIAWLGSDDVAYYRVPDLEVVFAMEFVGDFTSEVWRHLHTLEERMSLYA